MMNQLSSAFSVDYKWSIATFTMEVFPVRFAWEPIPHWRKSPSPEPHSQLPAVAGPLLPSNTTVSSSKQARKKRIQPSASTEAQ